MPFTTAWLVVLGAALVGTFALFFLTRPLAPGLARNLLRWLPAPLLVVPAPLPGHDGYFAPAFVVAIFEWLFQANGHPGPAVRILLLTLAFTLLVILAAQRLLGKRRTTAQDV